MRQQTRILAGIGILALGLGAWYFVFTASPDAAERPAGVPLARLEQQNEPLTETDLDFRPEQGSAPAVGDHSRSGASASPPPLALPNLEERSFRPPIESLSPPDVTERRGLAAPDSPEGGGATPYPFLAHAADPLGEEPDEAEDATEAASLMIEGAEAEATPELSPVTPAVTIPAVAEAEPEVIEHVIQPGDTYSSLAVKYLGGVRHTRLIEEANPGKDPRRLFVGSKVNIPAASSAAHADASPPAREAAPRIDVAREAPRAAVSTAASAVPPIPADRSYQVQPGETWSDLARKFFGDANQWPRLYELNKDRVVRDPNALRAGTTIELPPGVIASTSP